MKTLTELTTRLITESKMQYTLFTNDIDVVKKNCENLTYIKKLPNDIRETFEKKIKNISNQTNSEKVFIYSITGTKFKIPYVFNDLVLQEFSNSNIFNVKQNEGTHKIKIYYKRNLLFETGDGSIGKITTPEQEVSTCIIWNNFVENNGKMPNNTIDIVKHISGNFVGNDKWENSLNKQVSAIKSILDKLHPHQNDIYLNYRMCKYGSSEYLTDEIGELYETMIKKYSKLYKGNKNHFDPTDVILYRYDEKHFIIKILGKLIETLDSIKDEEPLKNVKDEFFKLLFNTRLLMGISLKQIVNDKAKYDLYNVIGNDSKISTITGYEQITDENKTNILCFAVYGNFNFDNISDSDGNDVNNSRCVFVTMRTFGNGQTGIDCSLIDVSDKTTPSLGKCSVKIWRDNILSASSKLSITEYIRLFKEKIKTSNDDDINIMFKTIITNAIKEGPACFPFILIH